MSDRLYGTEKVENVMGFPGKKAFNKIDLYIDMVNPNNLWGMVYYTEFVRRKPIVKQELVRFASRNAMLDYLKDNFDCYELTHRVDNNRRKIFFHYIDYCNVSYYLYEGNPKYNHVGLVYREHENGMVSTKTITMPKEYEEIFKDIIRTSKNIPISGKLDSSLYKTVDVYDEKNKQRQAQINKYTVPIGDFLYRAASKIIDVKDKFNKQSLVKGIKVTVSTVALASILAGGYKLVTDNNKNAEFVTQTNPITNMKDLGLYINKGNVGITIDKLMENNFEDVSLEDLKSALSFITDLVNANYDNNASFNSFNYEDYFDYKMLDNDDYMFSREILKKIEKLYNDSFIVEDGKVTINKDKANKYMSYVASLTFMYDTYHTTRAVSHVNIETQSIVSKSATQREIEVYDKYPSILKYIILNQLRGMIARVDFSVKEKPSYYFKGTDKYDLLNEISKKNESLLDDLYFKCGCNYRNRGM